MYLRYHSCNVPSLHVSPIMLVKISHLHKHLSHALFQVSHVHIQVSHVITRMNHVGPGMSDLVLSVSYVRMLVIHATTPHCSGSVKHFSSLAVCFALTKPVCRIPNNACTFVNNVCRLPVNVSRLSDDVFGLSNKVCRLSISVGYQTYMRKLSNNLSINMWMLPSNECGLQTASVKATKQHV